MLSSTETINRLNHIESMLSLTGKITRRVSRGKTAVKKQHWLATALLNIQAKRRM
jgi:hypothetical protein